MAFPPSIYPSSTAFVTFASIRTLQAALQCNISGRFNVLTIHPAPADPTTSLLWNNLPIPIAKLKTMQAGFALFWMVGVLFWAVPVTFVTGLANLNGLLGAAGLPTADPNAAWYGLVAGLLPVIFLAILMAVLFMAIVAAGKKVKKSLPEVDAYVFHWHMMYQFANLFLILIGGSLFGQLDAIASDPTSILKVFANALPGASIFFVNMIIVNSWGKFGLELSMLVKYVVRNIMSCVRSEATLTQRQLDDMVKPPSVVWGQHVPPVVFVFMVVLVYQPIVPVMEVFGFCYFAGMHLVWKYQMLHVYAQEVEGGGEATWQRTFEFLMGCLYISEGVFIVYMGLKESPAAVAFGFVPLGWTLVVHHVLLKNTIRPLRFLSMSAAAEVDAIEKEKKGFEIPSIRRPKGSTIRTEALNAAFSQPVLNPVDDEREPRPYRRALVEETASSSAISPALSVDEIGDQTWSQTIFCQ